MVMESNMDYGKGHNSRDDSWNKFNAYPECYTEVHNKPLNFQELLAEEFKKNKR